MIRFINVYEAVYNSVSRHLQSSNSIVERLPVGTVVQRVIEKGKNWTDWHQARTIRRGAANTDQVRCSGARPSGTSNARDGALYLSVGYSPNLAENIHYNLTGPSGAFAKRSRPEAEQLRVAFDMGMISPKTAMVRHVQFIYRTSREMNVMDPQKIARALQLNLSDGEKRVLLAAGYKEVFTAITASDDYSAGRALGHALVDHGRGLEALYLPTARSIEHMGIGGNNLIVFGNESVPITFLEPVALRVAYLGTSNQQYQSIDPARPSELEKMLMDGSESLDI